MMRKTNLFTLLLTCGLAIGGNGMPVLAVGTDTDVPVSQAQEKEKPESISSNDIAAEKDAQSNDQAETEKKVEGSATAERETVGTEMAGSVNRVVSFTDYTGMRVTYDANVSQKYVYEVADGVLKAVKEKKINENGQETLGPVVFEGNVELKQPKEGEKYETISAEIFGGNQEITYVRLPAGVTVIEGEGFKDCTALKSVYLPSTVKEIGEGAFENCTAMTQLSIPKSVTAIGDTAFKGAAKLQLVQLRDMESSELASVGAYAFAGCQSLQQLTLPQSVSTVGEYAFQGCSKLIRMEMECDQIIIGKDAFADAGTEGGLVIVARKGSNAEVYAEENGLQFQEDRAH